MPLSLCVQQNISEREVVLPAAEAKANGVGTNYFIMAGKIPVKE
jgi:hypothetical protein